MFYHKKVHIGLKNDDDVYIAKNVSGKLFRDEPDAWQATIGNKSAYVAVSVPYAKSRDGYGIIQVKRDDVTKTRHTDIIDGVWLYDIKFGDGHRKYNVEYVNHDGENCTDMLGARHIANYFEFNKQAYFDGFTYENQAWCWPANSASLDESTKNAINNLDTSKIKGFNDNKKKVFDAMFSGAFNKGDISNQFHICQEDFAGTYYHHDADGEARFDIKHYTEDLIQYCDVLKKDMKDHFDDYKAYVFTEPSGFCFDDNGSAKYRDMYKSSFIDGYVKSMFVKTELMGIAMHYSNTSEMYHENLSRYMHLLSREAPSVATDVFLFGAKSKQNSLFNNTEVTDIYSQLPHESSDLEENYRQLMVTSCSHAGRPFTSSFNLMTSCLNVIKQREKELYPGLQPQREHTEEFVTLPDDPFDDLPFN